MVPPRLKGRVLFECGAYKRTMTVPSACLPCSGDESAEAKIDIVPPSVRLPGKADRMQRLWVG